MYRSFFSFIVLQVLLSLNYACSRNKILDRNKALPSETQTGKALNPLLNLTEVDLTAIGNKRWVGPALIFHPDIDSVQMSKLLHANEKQNLAFARFADDFLKESNLFDDIFSKDRAQSSVDSSTSKDLVDLHSDILKWVETSYRIWNQTDASADDRLRLFCHARLWVLSVSPLFAMTGMDQHFFVDPFCEAILQKDKLLPDLNCETKDKSTGNALRCLFSLLPKTMFFNFLDPASKEALLKFIDDESVYPWLAKNADQNALSVLRSVFTYFSPRQEIHIGQHRFFLRLDPTQEFYNHLSMKKVPVLPPQVVLDQMQLALLEPTAAVHQQLDPMAGCRFKMDAVCQEALRRWMDLFEWTQTSIETIHIRCKAESASDNRISQWLQSIVDVAVFLPKMSLTRAVSCETNLDLKKFRNNVLSLPLGVADAFEEKSNKEYLTEQTSDHADKKQSLKTKWCPRFENTPMQQQQTIKTFYGGCTEDDLPSGKRCAYEIASRARVELATQFGIALQQRIIETSIELRSGHGDTGEGWTEIEWTAGQRILGQGCLIGVCPNESNSADSRFKAMTFDRRLGRLEFQLVLKKDHPFFHVFSGLDVGAGGGFLVARLGLGMLSSVSFLNGEFEVKTEYGIWNGAFSYLMDQKIEADFSKLECRRP